jgi:hypothetical protein
MTYTYTPQKKKCDNVIIKNDIDVTSQWSTVQYRIPHREYHKLHTSSGSRQRSHCRHREYISLIALREKLCIYLVQNQRSSLHFETNITLLQQYVCVCIKMKLSLTKNAINHPEV